MKNYLLKTKENFHPKRRFFYRYKILIYIGVVLLVGIFGRTMLGGMVTFVAHPIFVVGHYIETSSATIPVYLRERTTLLNQIQTLQQEIESQRGIATTVDVIAEENKELRNLLGATSSPSILAGIIARPPYSPYDMVLIDKGARDGVLSGTPVYYGSNMALGYVRVVYEQYSLVTLFSSPNVESTVYVFGPNIFATAYGEGGGTVRMSIPQGIVVKEGDTVILPSLAGGVLGTVSVVQSIPTEPEQNAYITLEIPLQSIRLVRVGTHVINPISFDDALLIVQEVERTLFTFHVPDHYTTDTASTTNVYASSSSSTPSINRE